MGLWGNILDPNYIKQTCDIQERMSERGREEGKTDIGAGIRGWGKRQHN